MKQTAMRTEQSRRGTAAAAAALLALALVVATSGTAVAATSASVNGWARASGGYVPFHVNPNMEFYPVYSLSETDNNSSHGISAGFWPGFLVDATFFQFGYQPFERALMGVAESLWPNQPNEASAGTSDFGGMCKAGEVTKLALPFGYGEGGMPEPMLTGCQSMWTQYKSFVPWAAGSGTTRSAERASEGAARGASYRLGDDILVRAGHVTSSTDAVGDKTVSTARVVLRDVTIGDDLVIEELRAVAHAESDGTAAGSKATRKLDVIDATYQGTPVHLGADGVTMPGVGSINDRLAEEGLYIRLVDGESSTTGTTAYAETGGLVVRMIRSGRPKEVDGLQPACDTLENASPEPVGRVDEELADNPTYEDRPPYNQAPPRIEVNESVPPPVPCALFLFDRAVDVGVVLGGAGAAARFQPVPAFDFDFGGGSGGFDGGFGDGGFGGFTPPGDGSFGGLPTGGGGLPNYRDVPPVPPSDVFEEPPLALAGNAFDDAVAGTVRLMYALLALTMVAVLIGRRSFRFLIRQ